MVFLLNIIKEQNQKKKEIAIILILNRYIQSQKKKKKISQRWCQQSQPFQMRLVLSNHPVRELPELLIEQCVCKLLVIHTKEQGKI